MSVAKAFLAEIENLRKSSSRRRRSSKAFSGLPFELSLVSVSEADKFGRQQDTDRVNEFNEEVKQWAKETTVLLRVSVRSLIKKDVSLSKSIRPRLYYDRQYGKEVNRIGFAFNREGVYAHKGAGKGQGGFKGGSKWYNLRGELKTTKRESLFKMGTGNRQPKEWFNPIIEQQLPKLADIVANYSASMCIDSTRIFIN